jgi:hypothetical protein
MRAVGENTVGELQPAAIGGAVLDIPEEDLPPRDHRHSGVIGKGCKRVSREPAHLVYSVSAPLRDELVESVKSLGRCGKIDERASVVLAGVIPKFDGPVLG